MCAVQLEVRDIAKSFESGILSKKPRVVLRNISFKVREGTTFGIVGDSGIGKTTLGKVIAAIEKPSSGDILFHGNALSRMKKEDFSLFRRKVQMMFQDPESSLNPKKTIQKSLDEILNMIRMPKRDRSTAITDILRTVGLSTEVLSRFPRQISGGQNQRIALARIMLLEPEVIILDEPTSSLDISVQAQILNLLKSLQRQKGLTYIFISHDPDVIKFMCRDIGTMERGEFTIRTDRSLPD